MAIYKALLDCDTHPTADELYDMVARNGNADLSMATIYNTLEVFCQKGLCQKLSGGNGCCRFDGDTHDHLHFRNVKTGEIHDVPDEIGKMLLNSIPHDVINNIEKQMGVQLTRLNVELIGTPNPNPNPTS